VRQRSALRLPHPRRPEPRAAGAGVSPRARHPRSDVRRARRGDDRRSARRRVRAGPPACRRRALAGDDAAGGQTSAPPPPSIPASRSTPAARCASSVALPDGHRSQAGGARACGSWTSAGARQRRSPGGWRGVRARQVALRLAWRVRGRRA
jgi:hypothetical protein